MTAPRTFAACLPARVKPFQLPTAEYSSARGKAFFSSSTGARRTGEKFLSRLSGNDFVLGVNRVHESQRLLVWQHRLLHLIHHVGETDFVLRIGKGMAAARARM